MTQEIYSEIRIAIADDHETFRRGLLAIFDNEKKFNVIDIASNGLEILNLIKLQKPDVILMDIEMPKMNGIETTMQIKKLYPEIGILALSFKDDDDSIIDMINAGANGYLIKSAKKEEILEGIVTVYNGKNYYCSNASSKFTAILKNRDLDRRNLNKKVLFTEKELQIISLICKGLSAKEIGNIEGTSNRTIENQKQRIQDKMGVRNIAGIIMYAMEYKLLVK